MKFTKYQFNFNEARLAGLADFSPSPLGGPVGARQSEVIKGRRYGNTFHFTPFVHICSWIIPFSTLPNH